MDIVEETIAPNKEKKKRGGYKPRKRYVGIHKDLPSMSQVSPVEGHAALFYERGFFGLVWLEGNVRKVRDLKRW